MSLSFVSPVNSSGKVLRKQAGLRGHPCPPLYLQLLEGTHPCSMAPYARVTSRHTPILALSPKFTGPLSLPHYLPALPMYLGVAHELAAAVWPSSHPAIHRRTVASLDPKTFRNTRCGHFQELLTFCGSETLGLSSRVKTRPSTCKSHPRGVEGGQGVPPQHRGQHASCPLIVCQLSNPLLARTVLTPCRTRQGLRRPNTRNPWGWACRATRLGRGWWAGLPAQGSRSSSAGS